MGVMLLSVIIPLLLFFLFLIKAMCVIEWQFVFGVARRSINSASLFKDRRHTPRFTNYCSYYSKSSHKIMNCHIFLEEQSPIPY